MYYVDLIFIYFVYLIIFKLNLITVRTLQNILLEAFHLD